MKIYRYKTKILLFFFLVFALPGVLATGTFHGKSVSVIDGDSIGVMRNDEKTSVSLYGIDAPEKCQDYETKEKQFTNELVIGGREISVEVKSRDRYGKTV